MHKQSQPTPPIALGKQKLALLTDAAKRRRNEANELQTDMPAGQRLPGAVLLPSANGREYSALND